MTKITLQRIVTYVLGGPISCNATLTYPNPIGGDDVSTPGYTLSCDQPAGNWTDDAVLAAFVSKYPPPDYTVEWEQLDGQVLMPGKKPGLTVT